MKVKLIAWTNKDPLNLTSFAARTCYRATPPTWKEKIDVENVLWKTGHHTTLEHFFVSFFIDKIPVGDVTFGLHLDFPFYNTSQRSGRYAAMFFKSPYQEIRKYISSIWSEIGEKEMKEIMEYLKEGMRIFEEKHPQLTQLARKFLKEERPKISEENLEKTAPKVAQEQLRMFISVIFPTSLVYTVNLVSLAALHKSAWSPSLKKITEKMASEVLKKFPQLNFIFERRKENFEWTPKLISEKGKVLNKPKLKLIKIVGKEKSVQFPEKDELGPLDLLHFLPKFMENYFVEIESEVEVSLACFGQDQRHRTLRRSSPSFSGNFYLPPLLQEAKLENEAKEIFERWKSLKKKLPASLWTILAPYGAMVRYRKIGHLNAIFHEQNKRLCFLAQEEIYHLGCFLREELKKRNSKLVKFLEPPCRFGKCPEGKRFCGRDLKKIKIEKFRFPLRKV